MHEKVIDKPWGKEYWLKITDNYAFKRLVINKNKSISLQFHEDKEETMYINRGMGLFKLGNETFTVLEGQVIHIPPKTIHQVTSLTKNLEILEVSTPHLDDVVRIQNKL